MNRTAWTVAACATLAAVSLTCTASPATAAPGRTKKAVAAKNRQADPKFDLDCSGMMHGWSGGQPDSWKETFRIDLAANRWCRGPCGVTFPIGTVSDDRISLSDSHSATGGPKGVETVIGRMDGEIRERLMMGTPSQSMTVIEGFCTKAPFSGFGQRKF
jgi:hypothetical protein